MVNARKSMVLEIFQLSISDETHLKRLKRLEIYWKFLSPGVSVTTAGHISRVNSRNRKLQMGQISQRISGNVCKCQMRAWSAASFERDRTLPGSPGTPRDVALRRIISTPYLLSRARTLCTRPVQARMQRPCTTIRARCLSGCPE